MGPSFYPDPVFGWTFYAVLVGFLAVAAYLDIGRLVIPKKLTLVMLAAGVVFGLVRGTWLGAVYAEGDPKVWGFVDSPLTGAAYGLLCALAGFAVGFGLFFVLWVLGVVGGGDVKLMAALGVWVGPYWILVLIFGSVVVFLILGTVRLLQKVFRRGVQKTVFGVKEGGARTNVKKTAAGAQRRDKLIAYSLPVAVATAILLPLCFPRDLHLPVPVKATPAAQASTQP
jgi:Flp pilus assembly protein protease CpaA